MGLLVEYPAMLFEEIEGRSDDELRALGFEVVRPSMATAQVLLDLLQGSGTLRHATERDTSDEGWSSIPAVQRRALLRLDAWTTLLPGLPAGEARALALDPSLAMVDRTEQRLILSPGRQQAPRLLSELTSD